MEISGDPINPMQILVINHCALFLGSRSNRLELGPCCHSRSLVEAADYSKQALDSRHNLAFSASSCCLAPMKENERYISALEFKRWFPLRANLGLIHSRNSPID